MPRPKFPFRLQIAYTCGMLGWSVLVNIIGVMLPYFYLPPSNSGLIELIPSVIIFGVFNLLAIITSAGRLFDAFFDPFIGQLSDRTQSKLGRRIPFMLISVIPAIVFCCLVFHPFTRSISSANAWWLTLTLLLFFVSATTYIIPYNALLPELAASSEEKIHLSTYQQIGFVLGIVISAAINNVADLFQNVFQVTQRMDALQYSIWSLSALGGIFMFIPAIFINEKKYCDSQPSTLPLVHAIRQAFSNKNFRYYVSADFSYYMSLYIITSGLLYFLTVLCGLPGSMGIFLMATMVIISLLFYPLIIYLAKKYGKKRIVLISFLMLSGIFIFIFFLGKMPVSPTVQIYSLIILTGFPLASLGILPPAILAEIAQEDAIATGENKEGLFFAVKYFAVKLGQTFGISLFAMLTLYGKDPGNDFGLRLNGVFGAGLCILAAMSFSKFKEKITIHVKYTGERSHSTYKS